MQDWITELTRILTIQTDYVVEPSNDALLKNAQLPSCWGILISFGNKGDTRPRSFQSTYAMVSAAIRSAAFNITIAVNAPLSVGGRRSPLDDYGESY